MNSLVQWRCERCREHQTPIYVDEDVTYVECEYCESKHTIYMRVVNND